MTYPKRPFYDLYVPLPVPQGCMAQEDTRKWEQQRFDFTSYDSRRIGVRLYRFFKNQPPATQIRIPKQELLDEVFTREEQFEFANVHQVGRHIVNSVRYRRVVHQLRLRHPDGTKSTTMCWQFFNRDDPMWGVACQIARWLPDHLLRNVPDEYPGPESITTEALMKELTEIGSLPLAEVDEMYCNILPSAEEEVL